MSKQSVVGTSTWIVPCPVPAGQQSCPSQQSVEHSCARTWNQRRLASSEPRIWYLDCNADLLSYMLSSCLFDNCSGREALPTQSSLKLIPPIDVQGTWLQTNPVLPGFQASDMKAGHEDTTRALIIRLGLWSLVVYLKYGARRSCVAFCMRIIRMTSQGSRLQPASTVQVVEQGGTARMGHHGVEARRKLQPPVHAGPSQTNSSKLYMAD